MIQFSNGVVELLVVYNKALKLCIVVAYRQPDQFDGFRSTTVQFKEAIDKIHAFLASLDTSLPNVILCGDFNLPNAYVAKDSSCKTMTAEIKRMFNILRDLCTNVGLCQVVDFSTHIGGNILDLVFVNNEFLSHSVNCYNTPQCLSHHDIIEVNTNFSFSQERVDDISPPPYKGMYRYNFFHESINWENVKNAFDSYDWNHEFEDLDVHEMTEKFVSITDHVCSQFIPFKIISSNSHSKIPRNRKILMRRRRKLNLKLSSINISLERKSAVRKALVQVEKDLLRSYSSSRNYQESKAVNSIKKNSKYFFSYVKKLSKTKSKVGPLITDAGDLVSDSKEMADLLSKQFCSVFSPQRGPIIPAANLFPDNDNGENNVNPSLTDFTFTVEDIVAAIMELSLNSAPGPDGFSSVLLRNCALVLAYPLFLIYRISLDSGVVPRSFKTGNVTPLFKSGSKGLAVNYRPITLTSHLSKVFEKIVRNHLLSYLESNGILNDVQHGFRKGRSCISQLISHFEKIIELLETGANVDVIYLHFSKVFDKLDFNTLLSKIKSCGISGKLGRWLHSFLTGRKQYVTVNGFSSFIWEILSGVPQGSVLGPLLFIIFINDIDSDIVSSFLSSFADDTRIGRSIRNLEDNTALQHDLDAVYAWSDRNNMVLNMSKFERLVYGKNKDSIFSLLTSAGEELQPQEDVKDLGIYMSANGNFSFHIENVLKKVKRLTSWALRNFVTRSVEFILTVWKSVILPHIDYGSQLWAPYKKGDIQSLEMTQRCFLKKAAAFCNMSYWDILKSVGLFSLQRRHERYRIIYLWCILEGLVPNPKPSHIYAKHHTRHGRTCHFPIVKSGPFQTMVYSSFSVQSALLFNSLPSEIRNLKNCQKSVFKSHLDNYLKTVPDEPQIVGYTACRRAESNSLLHMIGAVH